MITEQLCPNSVHSVVLHSQLILSSRQQPAPAATASEEFESLWTRVNRIYDQYMQRQHKSESLS